MYQRPYDLIIFDWDGALMDSAAHIVDAIQSAARDSGLPEPSAETARHVIGLSLPEAIAKVAPALAGDRQRYDAFVERYRHHFFTTAMQRQRLFEGVEELLAELQTAPYWLAVATGKGRRGLDLALEETRLGRFFLTTRTAEETASKPDPQMLIEILEEVAVAPERALMVGDTSYDLEMAARAGMHSVGVSCGAHDLHHLEPHSPLVVLDDIRGLSHWLLTR